MDSEPQDNPVEPDTESGQPVGPQRLADKAVPWFADAFNQHGGDEPIVWDISIMALPDPTTQDEFTAALVLYCELPGAVDGTSIFHSSLLPPYGLTLQSISDAVAESIKVLRGAREQQAEHMDSQQEAAQAHGQAAPVRGRIPASAVNNGGQAAESPGPG